MRRFLGIFRPRKIQAGVSAALVTILIALLQVAPACADSLAQWQWKNPIPQGNALRSVTYGVSSFVAVGDVGTIVTSTDGATWLARKSGNLNDLKGVTYGARKFVAVGELGTILTSSDGRIWSDVSANFKWTSTSSPRPTLNGITYGNNLFYAVGDNGTLLSSGDGVTWTNNSSGTLTTKNLAAITYSNYTFVAVGANGTVLTLLNSGVWQVATSGTANSLNAVATDRNRFAAVGVAGTVITSTDGINWSPQASGTGNTLLGVNAGKTAGGVSYFVVTGEAGTLLSSPDGALWSTEVSGTNRDLRGSGAGSSVFAVVGDGGSIVSAADPTGAWTSHLTGPVPSLTSIAYGSSVYVAVGKTGTIVYSTDGASWSSVASGTIEDLNSVAYGSNGFVAVGNGGVLLNSFDGSHWSLHFSGTANFNGVTYDSRTAYARFVAVGDAGSVATSPDGMTWTAVSPAATTKKLKAVALGDNLLVAVGEGGTVLTSVNGTAWTARTGITKDLTGVTVAFKPDGSTTYVTVGAAGTIYSSTDGVKWTAAKTVPTTYKTTDFYAVACDFDSVFSTYVAVGAGGGILTSSDTVTWTGRDPATSYPLAGVSYLNKSYWAVAEGGAVLNSNRLDNYISISGTRSENGASISTDRLDFGYVEGNKNSFAITVKITNTGQTSNLNVTAPVLGGGDAALFSASASSCGAYPLVIAPGGSCSFDLTFAPLSAGAKTASITINSDDSATPVLTIPISAIGGLYIIVQPGPNGNVLVGSSAGAVAPGSMQVQVGDAPSLFMSPSPGYYTQEVVVDGVTLGSPPSYTFAPVSAGGIPHTLQASFSNALHSITAVASAGGSIYPAGVQSVANGATQAFTITPNTGYQLSSFKVDGASLPLTSMYTFPLVTSNHTLQATFTVQNYSMTATVVTNGRFDGAGGSVTPGSVLPVGACTFSGGNGNCNYGSSLVYTITPKPGYRLVNVFVDNASLGAVGSYVFPAPINGDHTIQAVFTNLVDITVTLGPTTPPNGSITPVPDPATGKVSVQKGASQIFTITPFEGNVIADVKADGASLGPISSYTFPSVQSAHALDVTFAARTHAINVSAGSNGKITDEMGTLISARATVASHATKVFKIVPDANYEVADVKVDGVSVAAVKTYVFTDVVAGHTIEALFRGKPWAVILSTAGPAAPKIGSIAFDLAVPAGVVLPLNLDPSAPLGEVDPASVGTLSGAAGSSFGVSLYPALDIATGLPIALGTAQVAMANGPGFAAGSQMVKLSFSTALNPPPALVPGLPDTVTDVNGAAIPGVTVTAAAPVALPLTTPDYPGGLYNSSLSIALSATPTGSEIHYTVNGLEPTLLSTIYKSDNSVPISVTGNTTLKYFAIDRATGNVEPVRTELYVIDKTAPAGASLATLAGVPPELTRQTGAVLTVGGRDIVSYKYLMDDAGKLTQASSGPEIPVATQITLAGLADGLHKLQVIGRDSAGNWQGTATTASWTVDTTLSASSISPSPGLYNAPLSVTLGNSKSTAKIYYTLDGSAPTTDSMVYTAPIPITATTTVRFFAKDPAGNVEPLGDPAVYTLLMLMVNPPLSPTTDASPTFSGTFYPSDAAFKLNIKKGITAGTDRAITAIVGSNWSYGLPGKPDNPLAPGLNTITFTVEKGGKSITETVYVRVDATPCVVADGDIDRDGQVSMADVDMSMRMSIGLLTQPPGSASLTCGDVFPVDASNVPIGDGIVNVIDTLCILRKMMGLSSYLP